MFGWGVLKLRVPELVTDLDWRPPHVPIPSKK